MERTEAEKKIGEISDKIIREYHPEKIILFGSWAWGESHEDSDIDLLVVMESDRPRIERQREMCAFFSRREIALDILVYTPNELEESINKHRNLFLEDIVYNGKMLYTKPGFHISLVHEPAELVKA
mgnify:FL=1